MAELIGTIGYELVCAVGRRVPRIYIRDGEVAEAVNYLLNQGHRNIGIIGGDRHVSRTAKQRFMGCVRSFEKHGLEFDAENYFEKGRFSFESSYEATKRLLEKNLPISAVS